MIANETELQHLFALGQIFGRICSTESSFYFYFSVNIDRVQFYNSIDPSPLMLVSDHNAHIKTCSLDKLGLGI